MSIFRLAPDAILVSTNLAGGVSLIQDDPDAPDASFLNAPLDGADTVLRVSFPSPVLPLATGSGAQSFRVLVRRTTLDALPTMQIEVLEAGVVKVSGPVEVVTDSTVGEVHSLVWDADVLTDLTGAGVECRVNGFFAGSLTLVATVEEGAVEWNAQTVNSDLVVEGSGGHASATLLGASPAIVHLSGGGSQQAVVPDNRCLSQRLAPDGTLTQTNLVGTLVAIQDDPDAPDGLWWTRVLPATPTNAAVSFGTPSFPPIGTQEFRVLLRAPDGPVDATIFVREAGLPLQAIPITVTGTQIFSVHWPASLLSVPSGSGVEIQIQSLLAAFELGAVEWNVNQQQCSGQIYLGGGGSLVLSSAEQCPAVLSPNTIQAVFNLAGTVAAIQDRVENPDGNWLTRIAPLTPCRVQILFPVPPDPLEVIQRMRVLVRAPDVASLILVQVFDRTNLLTESLALVALTPQIIDLFWSPAQLTDPTAAGIIMLVTSIVIIPPSLPIPFEVGAVEWITGSMPCAAGIKCDGGGSLSAIGIQSFPPPGPATIYGRCCEPVTS